MTWKDYLIIPDREASVFDKDATKKEKDMASADRKGAHFAYSPKGFK